MKQTKLKKNLVGIDVSSKELVVKIEKDDKLQDGLLRFDNTKAGHKKLSKYITKYGYKARICMESTGRYHFELALHLAKLKNAEVMVANPKTIKHFAIASMKRAKTDPVDAETLLQYVKRMEFIEWQAPAENCLQLQVINRRIYQLKAEIIRESNRRHAGEYMDIMADTINNDIEVNIRHLQNRIVLLENKALEIIKSDESLKKKYDLLITIKGVAKTSGIQILSELITLPEDMRAEQWVAYVGLDPRPFESGSSVNKPRRISKAGNKYLRTALYMPAWVAVQSEEHVKAFYNKLIAAGKKPMQAIVAVMRKLLHAIWGMLNSSSSWNGAKFYKASIAS